MNRRRILVATAVACLAAGTVGAATATADTADTAGSPLVRTANDDYILCVGLETLDVATCIESPTGIIVELLRNRPRSSAPLG